MRTPSGDLHVVDFKTSQIVSAIQPKDYWDDKRHWEIKNNIDTLEFRVFENTDHAATLVQQNLVLKEVRGGRIVPYVITEAEKNSDDKSLIVYASGEWIQLAKAGIIEPQKIESKTLKQCMEIALKGTKWEIGKTEHDGAHSMVIEEFIDPLNLLKKISASFELEIQYRAEVVGSQIVARYVDMVKKRGRDTRKEITLGKDLMGIKRIENSQNICTALLGYVTKDNGEFITISEINNGVPYLVDDAAFQRWNEKGKHKFAFYTPQTEDQDMSPQRLMTLMKTEMNKLVNTSVSYEVQAQSIGRIFGLAHELINEGDTIRIIDTGFTPKLYLEARAIAGDESFKDPTQDKYAFGDYREIVDQNDELRRLYQKILSSLYDKVPQDLFDQLQNKVNEQDQAIEDAKKAAEKAEKESKIAKDLAEATVDYVLKNTAEVIEQPTAPTENLKDGKTIWVNNSDPNNKVMYLWSGGQWTRITPDTGELEKATADLQQEVEAVEQEISDIQIDINSKVDQTWLDEEMKKKANTDDVYTKDYVDKNLVGKQTYEVDKQTNIKAFSDMNTKYEQTAEALKLTATKEELKQTDTNVTNVTKTVNDVKISADENSKKIEKVEGDFKNMKIGSVNLAIESEFICDVKNATANYSSIKTLKTSSKVNFRNKKVTLSYILTGNITGKGTNPWTGAEIVVRYADDEAQYLSIRRDASAIGTTWLDALQSQTFTIKDKDVKSLMITTGSRDVFGNINISHVQLEEGTIPTAWNPAIEEAVSTGDFTKTTNEIKQTVESNTATITKLQVAVENGNENILVNSSANNEYPEFPNDVGGHSFGRSSHVFKDNYIELTSIDGADSFYQVGSYKLTDLRGLNAGDEFTFSADLKGDSGYAHLVVFQSTGTGWNESGQLPIKVDNTGFTRGSYTFKLKSDAKGIILRVRYPMGANSTGKKLAFKDLKLEHGSISTAWDRNRSEVATTKQTNEIKQTVDSNTATISSLNQSVGSLSSQTNAIQQTVDKNTAEIGSIGKTQGTQGAQIQTNTSKITQLSNEISSSVTDTEMRDYIGNIGKVNMISNSAFEDRTIHPTTGIVTSTKPSIAKWEARGTNANATVMAVNARHHEGYNSVKIECSGLTDANFTNISQSMPIVDGSGAYIFSVWIFTDNANGIDEGGAIEMTFRNGSTQVATKLTYFDKKLPSNTWTQLSVKLEAPTQPANEVNIRIYVRKNGRVWLSQPMVVQGSELSTFMENPKDITNYDQLIGEVAKKVATSEFNQKVTTMQTDINQNTKAISLRAEKTEVYNKIDSDGRFGSKAIVERHESEIKLQAEEISSRVKSGDIASTINQTAQAVLIQANKINLVGAVTAESINSGILRGTQIYTNADTSGNYLKLEKQHLTLMNGTQPRGYFGFISRTDSGIQSALVLGNDYAVNKQLEGSLVIDHVVQGTAWTNAVASIGIASGGKTGNDINKSSYINFYRYMDKMEIRSQGPIEMNAIKGDIKIRSNSSNGISIDSATYMNFNSNTATYLFNNGRDIVDKWTLKMSENGINSGDVDLNIGNQLTLRVARAYPYTMEGLQVKNNKGNDYAGVSCGTLTYGSLSQRSTRQLKTAIKDIEAINPLDKLMELTPRQYYMKADVNKLYEKRQEIINSGSGEKMPTYEDIAHQYGFVAEEVPEPFATEHKKTVNMYPLITIGIAGTQEVYKKHLVLEETVKTQAEKLEVQAVAIQKQEDRIARLEELLIQKLIN
ncbi:phage tail spike protein [Bacillus cereus]|uniref:phage tail spike protein n=1 Tax=Bacillus cereus TaxID=1396 RepID=UPI0018F34985|nr:phage tail spike protein [Bacillus cereus]MBJ8093501.1 phage tail protein [Bacillus cereus]